MNSSPIVPLALLVIALSAQTAELPTSQWKIIKASLSDLIADGYSVIAVTSEAPASGASSQTFFLQKSTSFCKCSEEHVNDVKAEKYATFFSCWELVKPYGADRKR